MTPEERQAFTDTADLFLAPANDLVGIEPIEKIAAAQLYACARYNIFAMQAQVEDPTIVDAETVDLLCGYFEKELRVHMAQALGSDVDEIVDIRAPIAVVADVIAGLDDREESNLSDFLDLADRFIDVANTVQPPQKVSRLSACFMHACARFNVYVMQRRGLPPGAVDETQIAALSACYRGLADRHRSEILIKPSG